MREGWKLIPLSALLTKRTDFTPIEDGVSYRCAGVQRSGWGIIERDPFVGGVSKFSKLMRLEKDNFVYRVITAFEAPSAVVDDDTEGMYVSPQTFPVFKVNETTILPAYLKLLTTAPSFHHEMAERCTGSVLRRMTLSVGALLSISINLPPLEEQQRIVDLFGSLDEAIGAAESSREVADHAWWALAGELEMNSSGVPSLPLGEITDIAGGLTKDKKSEDKEGLVQAPYLRVANVHRRYLDLNQVATVKVSPAKLSKLRLLPGDILMNEGGDKDKLGRGAVWSGEISDCIHQNHVFRARITDENFSPDFVSAWANSFGQRWFETFGTKTTGIASVSKTTLSKFPVPALSLERQREWAALLGSVVASMDAASSLVEKLRSLRSELLSVLLSGEHEIPESYDALLTPVSQFEPAA